MSLPERFTMNELLIELGRIKPAPVSRYCYPCSRCNYERQSSQPAVALGLYTAEGLVRHLEEVHAVKP